MTSSTEKPDTVYLYQFPRTKELPNISPYCLKVETFLKVNKIPYECVYTMSGRSKQGLLPFIKLNGEQIDDSELILHKLAKHFPVQSLDARDEALSHSVSRMVDSHMSNVIYKYKGLGDPEGSQWVEGMLRGQGYDKKIPGPIFKGMLYMVLRNMRGKMRNRIGTALGNFPDEDFNLLLHKDLTTIKDILGDKMYLFGDDVISVADCTVFSQLAAWYYLPHKTLIQPILENEYPTIKEYLDRIRDTVFGDEFTQ